MTAYTVYLILAVFCFIGELFTMDFSLTCFGLGLLAAAFGAWINLGANSQVTLFVCVSILAFISVRPFAKKLLYKHTKHVKTNVDALIGRTVTVLTAPGEDHIGRVQTDGDNWRAHFAAAAEPGQKVLVEKMEGNTLFVAPISNQEEAK